MSITVSIAKSPATLKDYLSMARPDNWFKNLFMLPGLVMAWSRADHISGWNLVWQIFIAAVSTCLITSANYILNEWLDAGSDRHHPIKKMRAAVHKSMKVGWILVAYISFAGIGLASASLINTSFLICASSLLVMGFFYNVPPFRSKEIPYLDVLSESVNNPIRFLLGWSVVLPGVWPATSLLLAYWCGGAFLMACKRFAEYRFLNDPEQAARYRKSFGYYTETSLFISIFFYGLSSTFLLGIFLVRYKIELFLTYPLFFILFAWYLVLTLHKDSPAQRPELLYRNRKLMLFLMAFLIVFLLLLFVRIEWLHHL